ncbi:glycosyl hydrolase family 8 [Rhizobium sp. EC-SD404]|uniref:glycosyl hydrolase family 8 n=1 Tax=Rhizobium sp. EC-SD404 TaxID=2038389 RepID=UPI00125446C5|nr:glycosyl hydrolase family 8 [Rhizobium sp. EC-SD404]VVT14752.1 Endoglucanase [Rhizobium sp. EC-SD404]
MSRHVVVAAFLALITGPAMSQSMPSVSEAEWSLYSNRFVTQEGRVLDDANDGISHSEGQGYGLLLAQIAGARADFERIWTFTRNELLLRDDGLAAWKWQADETPNVTDINNATDGDILIAYALARAGAGWEDPRLVEAATRMAEAIGTHLTFEHEGQLLLSPGVTGFSAEEREDGPVVNLSYWVFEAFPVLAGLAPNTDWEAIGRSGVALAAKARFSDRRLPPDWLSLAGEPKPAEGFPAEFSYNALRIPLYLMRSGMGDADYLSGLRDGMVGDNGQLDLIDLTTGDVTEELTDAGYRIIPAMIACVVDDVAIERDLLTFAPTVYYPSTLHLLALSHLRENYVGCIE